MAVPTTAPTLFGAYIQSISTSMGWGGQGGTCQLVLIEDPQTDPDKNKVIPKFDENGDRDDVNGKPFSGDEDGSYSLTSPKIGTAAGIRYGDFYFGGVFQRWSYSESLSGRIYNVILESPAKLLDGIQVILDEFQGTVFSTANAFYPFFGSEEPIQFDKSYVNNVWNVFGELENYAYNDQTGGHFGNGDVNSVGMPVLTLLEILQKFGDDADGIFGGPAEFGSSKYKFDFSEVKQAIEDSKDGDADMTNYRVKGPIVNLNGILSDICDTMQHQYFPQVIGPAGFDTDGIENPTIKIRMIDMGSQPQAGVIEDLVDNVKSEGKLISSSIGQELQDATTQKVVIGAPASRYYDAPVSTFFSVWKKSVSGRYQFDPVYASARYADPSHTNTIQLPYPDQFGNPSGYTASIFELRMALGGMEAWESYKAFQSMLELEGGEAEPNGSLYIGQYPPWFGRVFTTKSMLEKIAGYNTVPLDLINTFLNQAGQAYNDAQKKLAQKMFNVVNKAATEFYGQVFFAALPYELGGIQNNFRWISEDFQYETAWTNVDSAWYYDKSTGQDQRPVGDVLGYDGSGRLKSHSTFIADGISDFSTFGGDYSVGFGGRLCTTKGGPDKDLYWILDPTQEDSEDEGEQVYRPYCIVRTGGQVRSYDSYTTPDFGLTVLAQLFFNIDIPPGAYITPGKGGVQIPIPPAAALPASIGVPQESNVYRWGPWYKAALKNGKAEVVLDDNLSPETFGSSSLLDQAGIASAFSGVGRLEAVESGYVEVAEFPSFNVGDRWADQGPYVTDLQIDVSTDGCKCTYKFNTWTPNFGKLAKYNMDRIARVNQASLNFAQQQRSRIEKRPLPSFSFQQTDFGSIKNGGSRFTQQGIQTIQGIMRTVFS